jgi:hypothetical protein
MTARCQWPARSVAAFVGAMSTVSANPAQPTLGHPAAGRARRAMRQDLADMIEALR